MSRGDPVRAGTGRLRAIALALLLLVVVDEAFAAGLGRLFLTPAQRTALELRRRLDVPAASSDAGPLRLDGVVHRSDGRVTIWINGHPQRDDAIGPGAGSAAFTAPSGQPDRIHVRIGETSAVSLRVGETLRPALPTAESERR